MDDFRLRQVHLDFHTSPAIPGIGINFDKKQWQEMLKLGHVDSITVFSKCHHGYSYHPTKANEMHPNLNFDLLKAQIEASAEIGVKTPVYISAGFDEKEARKHPEWLQRNFDNKDETEEFKNPGYHLLCFNTDYLQKLLGDIEEVMILYNPCEIFLDILGERICYCKNCRESMEKLGLDYNNFEDVKKHSRIVYRKYLNETYRVIKKHNPETLIYHNSGHLTKGRHDLIDTMEHFELESLPTGGWGYDHFPMSAAYARTVIKDYLGMTGKFHGTWGEFGGFKHPNALIYETALSLSQGAGCSIGDQMHPDGLLNPSTFSLIGKAYSEVEKKEPWCKGYENVADIGVLAVESMGYPRHSEEERSDFGVNRILLETKRLYNFIDKDSDFSKYKLIIMPDFAKFDRELLKKTEEYLSSGGKLLLSGISGTGENGEFLVDTGLKYLGENEFKPTYYIPEFDTVNGKTPYLMRCTSHKTENRDAVVLAYSQNPYFNRTAEHFCSHQHAPNNDSKNFVGAAIKGNIAYIGWNVFGGYGISGDFHIKEFVSHIIDILMEDFASIKVTNLPDRGIASLTEKGDSKIVHLLFAHTSKRGKDTEVIEDIVPVYNVNVSVTSKKPQSVKIVPENISLEYSYENEKVSFTVPRVYIHSMIEII